MRGPDHRDVVDLEGTRFQPESGDLAGPNGRRGRLAPQPARLLALLVAHRGSVVSRKEIGAHLWPAGAVEIDAGIGFAVREIRKGLESVGADAELIETIPRRGYRLRAAASPLARAPGDPPADPPAGAPGGGGGWGGRAVVLGVAVVGALLVWGLRGDATPTIAVFPYALPEAGVVEESLSSELGARVTTRLTNRFRDQLGVIGPLGVADLPGPDDTEGARALGACLVLSGSARTAVDTGLVVFTQIVRTSDRVHLWARWDTLAPGASLEPFLDSIASGAEAAGNDCGRQ